MACPIVTASVAVVHSARKCPAPAAFRSFSNAARSRREVCIGRPDLLLRSPRTWREGRRTTPIAAAWGADVQFSECKVVSTSSVADKSVQLQAIAIDIGPLADGYKKPGQFVQVKVEGSKPGFFAITSPPGGDNPVVELLIKNQPGSTAELLCNLDEGAAVDVSPVMGKGFPIETVDPEKVSEIVLFAQGTGISPIKALIESGLLQGDKRGSVSLYYGARSAEEMAFQDSFAEWEKLGVHVVPVYSSDGEGYVQLPEMQPLAGPGQENSNAVPIENEDAYKAAGSLKDPTRTAVVLCGSKEMCEDVKTLFMGQGVPTERFLLNF